MFDFKFAKRANFRWLTGIYRVISHVADDMLSHSLATLGSVETPLKK